MIEGDGTSHVVSPDKYKSDYDDHPVETFETTEAALDYMHENTHTLTPCWPLHYIPRQARFLRALCDDPEDATFASLGFSQGEEITLETAVTMFYEAESQEVPETDHGDDKLSAMGRLKRLLDTPVTELFNDRPRPDTRANPSDPDASRLDPSTRREADRHESRDLPPILYDLRQIEADNADGLMGTTALEGRPASDLHPDSPRDTHGSNPEYDLIEFPEEERKPFEWNEPHSL